MNTLKTIEPNVGYTFEANGKKYVLEDKLSIARAIEAGKIELEIYDLNQRVIKNTLISAYNDLNGSNPDKTVKFADAAQKIGRLVNKLEAGVKMEDDPVFRYAAMYINQENEDRRIISDELINEKIKDWNEAGLTATGFFLFILSVIPSASEMYQKVTEEAGQKPIKLK